MSGLGNLPLNTLPDPILTGVSEGVRDDYLVRTVVRSEEGR